MWSTSEAEKGEICRAIDGRDHPRVLEIGAFKGETTRVLAEAASRRGGIVVVIDPMRWAAEVAANGIARHLPKPLEGLAHAIDSVLGGASYEAAFWEHVDELGPYVRLHRALSGARELLASDAPELQEFDVVFIDGDHSYEGARADLEHWGLRTARGGTILVHDATPAFPGVVSALEEFGRRHQLRVEYPVEGSLAIIRVPL
jgi:predicted O-methyltransferase YrrM